MTAGCPGGGPSAPKGGFDPIQVVIGNEIGVLLVEFGMPELAAALVTAGTLQWILSQLCTTDPPTLPVIDADRIRRWYDINSPDAYPLILKDAQDILGHFLWWQWCDCTPGPNPPVPTPIPFPPGIGIDDPSNHPPQAGGTCDFKSIFETKNFDASGNILFDFQQANGNIVAASTWLSLQINGGSVATSPVYPVTMSLQQLSATGVVVQEDFWSQTGPISASTPEIRTFTANPVTTALAVRAHTANTAAQTFGTQMNIAVYCTPPPPEIRTDCCPPDPNLENLILQVLRLEQLILNSLGGSKAYVRGTAHTGISGSGSLTISGRRGMAVDITAGSPPFSLPGTPAYQWDVGWMSISDGGGMIQEQRITRTHQVWLPDAAELAVTFGFFLNPGFVATFTELDPA